MKQVMVRLGLSLMVAAGWWVQRLPAQSASAPAPLIVISATADVAPPVQSADQAGHLARWHEHTKEFLNKYGRCCSSDVNNPGCSGWRADLQFVFGSCRYWFGEPCLPMGPGPFSHHPLIPKN
jgi:hypothetical protein